MSSGSTFTGGTGANLVGTGFDDIFRLSGAPASIDGGLGFDRIVLTASFAFNAGTLTGIEAFEVLGRVTADFSRLTDSVTVSAPGVGTNSVTIIGGFGGDIITGGAGNDSIDGRQGNDVIDGGDGNDSIVGGPGYDIMLGGNGNDSLTMRRGTGPDYMDGGAGTDRASIDLIKETVDLRLDISNSEIAQQLGDGTTVVRIEQISILGGVGDDTFTGGNLADTLNGHDGQDVLRGNGGNDTITGGNGYDIAAYGGLSDHYQVTLLTNGTVEVRALTGSDGVDILSGIETLRFADGDFPVLGYTATATYWGVTDGTATFVRGVEVPDGRGADPGTGFTNTGLTRLADGTFLVANQGQANEFDTTYTASIVHLGADLSTKLAEINLPGNVRAVQGVAYKESTGHILFASLSEKIVRIIDWSGNNVGTIALPTGISPNALAYDPVLDAAIVGRSDGSANNNIVEWRAVSNGALLKSLTISTLPDHFFFAANEGAQGTLYFTQGKNGGVGYVYKVDVATGLEIGRIELPEADAIEGVAISGQSMWIGNDAYYHRGNPPENRTLEYTFTPAAQEIDKRAGTLGLSIDLNVHSQTLADGTQLVGVQRVFFHGGSGSDTVIGGQFDDVIVGGLGDDTLSGGAGTDRLVGGAGNDTLRGGTGDDRIEGAEGAADIAVFSGNRADYEVTQLGDSSLRIRDLRAGAANEGTDLVSDVETFQFADRTSSFANVFRFATLDPALAGASIDENAAAGMIVGTLSTSTNGPDTAFAYLLTDDAGGRFALDGNRIVATGTGLDREAAASHVVTVRVTDGAGNVTTENFTIAVADVNEAPTDLTFANVASVIENETAETRIADLVVADTDTNPAFRSFAYSVSDARFEVKDGALVLKAGAALDFETESTIPVEVTVSDGAGSVTRSLTVQVTNWTGDDAPGATLDISLAGGSVNENAGAGTVIGTLSTATTGTNSTFTYTIIDDAGGRFALDGNEIVATGTGLDHETATSHVVTVRVEDGAGNTTTESFTIGIGDVNEAPSDLAFANVASVIENATAETRIADLTVTDPDTNAAFRNFSYTVSDARFEVKDGALVLKAGAALDFETESTIPVEVTVSDGAGSVTRSLNVQVTNWTGDDAPGTTLDISLAGDAVNENAGANAVVGALSTSTTGTNTAFTYALTNDAGGRFALDGSQIVATGTGLDHEDAASHSITVRVEDGAGNSRTESFVIGVSDVNEAPTDLAFANVASVVENATAETRIADLTVTDPDVNPAFRAFTYSVSDARFEVKNGALVLKAGAALDFETQSTITVEVTVSDGAGSVTCSLNVQVTNWTGDDAATLDISLAGGSVNENAGANAVVGTLSTATTGGNTAFTYALTNDAGGRFALNGSQIVALAGLNFEAAASHQIAVRVQDGAGNSTTESFTVTVGDVNEAPTDLTFANVVSVAENTAVATRIADLTVLDPDTNPAFRAFTYTVSDSRFEVTNGSLFLKAGQSVDFETQSSINLTVTANDGAGQIARNLVVQVTDVAEGGSPVGTAGDDRGATAIRGTPGVDQLFGLGGHDELFGLAGNDTLDGGTGDDWLDGGTGADTLIGGDGTDTASYANAVSPIRVDMLRPQTNTGEAQGDSYNSIENIQGSAFADTINGSNSGNVIWGGDGNDSIAAQGGADTIFGGRGDDTLFGQGGNDTLNGGEGNDWLSGGLGSRDWYQFGGNWGHDTVADFDDNMDWLDFRGSGLSFSQLTITAQGGNTLVSGPAGTGSFLIQNVNASLITQSDFLF